MENKMDFDKKIDGAFDSDGYTVDSSVTKDDWLVDEHKHKKKLYIRIIIAVSSLLILCAAIFVSILSIFPKETNDGLLYYSKNGNLIGYTITGVVNSELTTLTIPSSCNGLPITGISEGAFYDCDSLTSVTIPDSVTSIGSSAFSDCDNLTSITVDENNATYESIDGNLYTKDGTTLIQYAIGKTDTEFTIPNSVASIGSRAFSDCDSLTSVTIGNGVTTIGDWAFSNCDSLTSVTIGNSVTSFGWSAFYGCSSLSDVTIGNGVTSIGDYAFYNCDSLTSITVDEKNTTYKSIDGNLYSKDGTILIQYAIGKTATEFTIPDGVTSIGNWAFSWCGSLSSVTIPDSVTSIGNSAFSGCSSLSGVTIGNGVTSIGDWAFSNCDSLTSVTIGNGVTFIGDWAFSNCDSLTSVTIGNDVTSIGSYAFA